MPRTKEGPESNNFGIYADVIRIHTFAIISTMATMFKFNTVIVCIVNVVFTFIGITLNSVVVINLWNTQLRKRLCYFMILILACFDLVVVVVFHPLIIFEVLFYCISMNFEKFVWEKYIYYLFVFSLTGLLTMISERYLALVHPFFHEKFVTKSRLLTAFVLFQIPCGVVFIMMNIQHLSLAIYYAPFGFFSIVICILNLKLFYIAKTLRKLALVNLGNSLGSDSEPLRTVKKRKLRLILASLGKISTCFLAVMCLFLCHIPTLVNIALKTKEPGQRDQSAVVVEVWAETFLTINSTLNCSIFFYKNSVLRRHGAKYLAKCCCWRWRSQE